MILAAVDIEGCSVEVVRVAGELARDLGLPLTLLHVAHLPNGVPENVVLPGAHENVHDQLVHEAADSLEELAAPWVKQGVEVSTDVRFGTPKTAVLTASHQLMPRFLVLGTHAREGLARLVLGSVEESITRHSPVPVVVVPSPGVGVHPTATHRALMAEEDG